MCGIAGVYSPHGEVSRDDLSSIVTEMANWLTHRGPDAGGAWVDARAGIGLGHRRLAIIDLSANGAQPMVSGCGRWVTAFNGEIYNFRELRTELAALGHSFRGQSDTEVVLAAVSEWGVCGALARCV